MKNLIRILMIAIAIGQAHAGSFTTTTGAAQVNAVLAAPGPIGSVTPNTGAFTTLTATGGSISGLTMLNTTVLQSNGTYLASPWPIGSTVPNTGAFTSLVGQLTSAATYANTTDDATNEVDYPIFQHGSAVILKHSNNLTFNPSTIVLNVPAGTVQSGSIDATVAFYLNSSSPKYLVNATQPTIASGFGTGAAIVSANGTATSTWNVGTGGTASSGVLTFPAAQSGVNCMVAPAGAPQAGAIMYAVKTSTTQVTITNYTLSTGAALAWPASFQFTIQCTGT